MEKRKLFSTSEFAKLSRTTRDRLHNYDRMGLLEPALRGENKYRYYSIGQISLVNLIRTLLDLGMPLAQIGNYKDRRTPERAKGMLAQQIESIDREMEKWVRSKKLLLTYLRTIDSVSDIDERAITIQSLPEERIVLGDLNDYSGGKTDYDALCAFYRAISKKYPGLDLNYPVWGLFTQEQVLRESWLWPDRFYFFNPDGPDVRPAGQYAVAYMRGGYGHNAEMFARLAGYIEKNDYEICGDAYNEYPLNEICIASEKEYLIRMLIAVREKKRTKGKR